MVLPLNKYFKDTLFPLSGYEKGIEKNRVGQCKPKKGVGLAAGGENGGVNGELPEALNAVSLENFVVTDNS